MKSLQRISHKKQTAAQITVLVKALPNLRSGAGVGSHLVPHMGTALKNGIVAPVSSLHPAPTSPALVKGRDYSSEEKRHCEGTQRHYAESREAEKEKATGLSLLPQWPFMRGIRHARGWHSIQRCP